MNVRKLWVESIGPSHKHKIWFTYQCQYDVWVRRMNEEWKRSCSNCMFQILYKLHIFLQLSFYLSFFETIISKSMWRLVTDILIFVHKSLKWISVRISYFINKWICWPSVFALFSVKKIIIHLVQDHAVKERINDAVAIFCISNRGRRYEKKVSLKSRKIFRQTVKIFWDQRARVRWWEDIYWTFHRRRRLNIIYKTS